MTTNKQTPLSDKDIYCTTAEEIVYSHKDVRDAVRRFKEALVLERYERELIIMLIEEIFGKELCEDNSQDISNTHLQRVKEGSETQSSSNPDTRKGCGKEFMWIPYLKDKRICGEIEDLKHSDNIILCPSCQEKMKEVKGK